MRASAPWRLGLLSLLLLALASVSGLRPARDAAAAQSGPSLTQMIERSLAAAREEGAPEALRLERFVAARERGESWSLDVTHRAESGRYRVWLQSDGTVRVIKQSPPKSGAADYWTLMPLARDLADLDPLIRSARLEVERAGYVPEPEAHIKYRMARPRSPDGRPLEIVEVFVAVEGDTEARRAIFHDRVFQRLTPAKLIKIEIPR